MCEQEKSNQNDFDSNGEGICDGLGSEGGSGGIGQERQRVRFHFNEEKNNNDSSYHINDNNNRTNNNILDDDRYLYGTDLRHIEGHYYQPNPFLSLPKFSLKT